VASANLKQIWPILPVVKFVLILDPYSPHISNIADIQSNEEHNFGADDYVQ